MGLRARFGGIAGRSRPNTAPDLPEWTACHRQPHRRSGIIARDGQQYGPLSDTELTKFVELGHLQPTDLLWREGFPDWRPAMVVFPPRKPAMQRPAPTPRAPGPMAQHAAPARGRPRAADAASGANAENRGRPAEPSAARELPRTGGAAPRRKGLRARSGGHPLPCRSRCGRLVRLRAQREAAPAHEYAGRPAAGRPARAGARQGHAGGKELGTSPLQGFRAAPDALDPTLQATPLWRILKRDFPDWYAERLQGDRRACGREQGRRRHRPADGSRAGGAAPPGSQQRAQRRLSAIEGRRHRLSTRTSCS